MDDHDDVGRHGSAGDVSKRVATEYLVAATIIWVAIWVATGALADDELDEMIPILGGGTFFFVVLVPAWLFQKARS